MKRLIKALALVTVLCLGIMSVVACDVGVVSKDGTVTSNEYFNFISLGDNAYAIEAKDVSNLPESLVLPSEYEGGVVTAIAQEAFAGATQLTSVYMPSSYKVIGSDAFEGCIKLKSVEFSSNIEVIEDRAFSMCEDLLKVRFTSKLTKIGAYAFYNCKKVGEFYVTANVAEIGAKAFEGCTSARLYVSNDNQVYHVVDGQIVEK